MILSDALALSDRRTTRDGYLVASARAARTGIQTYLGAEVGKPEMAVVRVYRPEEEVFHKDARASYAHKPITNDHPPEAVSATNWKDHAVGHVDGEIARDGEFIRIHMMIADGAAIAALDSGKRELSAGYTCDLDWTAGTTPAGEVYDAIQKNIRINHVALVDRGRAGSDCRIGDGGVRHDPPHKEPLPMTLKTGTVDGIPVEVTDQGATVINTLQTRLADAKTTHDRLVADHAATIAAKDAAHAALLKTKDTELATKDAEIEKLKASQVSDAQLDALATARADVIGKAKAIVADIKTDGQSIPAIRRAVVVAKLNDAAVKDKSDDYVEARFDLLADAAKPGDPVRDTIRNGLTVVGDAKTEADKARAKRDEELRNGWKGKAA